MRGFRNVEGGGEPERSGGAGDRPFFVESRNIDVFIIEAVGPLKHSEEGATGRKVGFEQFAAVFLGKRPPKR